MSLYTHWACFDCRKSFHNLPQSQNEIGLIESRKCPDCEKSMHDMGIYFEPPRRQAKKQWSVMKLLAESGYRFQTEGSKAFIVHYILCSKNSSLKEVQNRINLEKQVRENSRMKSRLKGCKEEKTRQHL